MCVPSVLVLLVTNGPGVGYIFGLNHMLFWLIHSNESHPYIVRAYIVIVIRIL